MGPLIGLTCQLDLAPGTRRPTDFDGTHRLPEAYVRAVRRAGGLPVLLPSTVNLHQIRQYLSAVHGLILTGGGDIDPHRFGEEPIPQLGPVDPVRDTFESELIALALQADVPVLAICKGAQLLNVVAGGTMIQDINTAVHEPIQHQQRAPGWYATHRIAVQPESQLAEILGGTEIRVNSFHHQAIGEPAPGFWAVAHASDGVVEAVESLRHRFVLGIQWHPELMVDTSEPMARLFGAFVKACR